MPNTPYFGYQNPFNNLQNPNNLTLEAFLEIKQTLHSIDQKINNLEKRIEVLENQKPKSFEYQTSMNMM